MGKTVINSDTKIEGSISSQTDLSIYGEVKGKIQVKQIVSLEYGCNVTGEIFAKELIVKGVFNGDADCDTISILEGGHLIGNIKSKTLIIDSKGSFEGKTKMKKHNNTKIIKKKRVYKELDTENVLL